MTEEQTFSAKQVARRIGTDAKTFRKWLRSTASPYEAVGQGQRYDFPAKDLPEIDAKFHAWKDKGSKLPPVNGRRTTKAPRNTVKVDREPGEHRGLPMTKSGKKLSPAEFAAERAARQAARDEVYGPDEDDLIDCGPSSTGGKNPSYSPGRAPIEELTELEDLELDDLDTE
jgi:hypothetical protein